MIVLYQSHTCIVNPPNAIPLTLSELWEVMLIKCRYPQLFVAPMSSCTVLSETATHIQREVVFKEGMGPPGGRVVEDLELRAPWKVDFCMRSSGNFVSNTISQGRDASDLYLTFYFERRFPTLEEGCEEAKGMSVQLWEQARKTGQHTVDIARKMKRAGKIQGLYEGKF